VSLITSDCARKLHNLMVKEWPRTWPELYAAIVSHMVPWSHTNIVMIFFS
jgi:hypothetical protein